MCIRKDITSRRILQRTHRYNRTGDYKRIGNVNHPDAPAENLVRAWNGITETYMLLLALGTRDPGMSRMDPGRNVYRFRRKSSVVAENGCCHICATSRSMVMR